MKTKLVFICGNLYPHTLGGAEVFNHYLIGSLTNEAEVVVINTNTSKDADGANHVKINPRFLEVILFPILAAIKVIGLSRGSNIHLVLTFSRSRWMYWVVYPLLKSLFGISYSIIIHGGGLMKWKFQAPFQFLFKKADHIIGISERITEEYSNRTGLNLNFVPPLIPFSISDKSVAEAKLERGIEPNSKVILMVGSLKLLKHPETAVEALINLGIGFLESQNIQLVFAGDGPDRPSLESKIMEAGISQHVRFLGNVSREEIADVYRASDLYIMASEFEGTPLSMLEAMANGIPVLASNAPGIATIIEHQNNGLLFTIGNGNELAEAIKTLINNHELSTKLTHKARLTLETRYDHGKMLDFYRKIWSL